MRTSGRALVSAVRTLLYGSAGGALVAGVPESVSPLEAFVLSILMVDFFTWTVWTLLHLPGDLWWGSYNTAVNLAFAFLLYQYVPDTRAWSSDALVAVFMGSLLTLVVKMLYYGYQHITAMTEDGCY